MKKLLPILAVGLLAPLCSVRAAGTAISATGWNRDVIVENTATLPYSNYASPFDVPNNYGFYQAGLAGASRGLPASRLFTSLLDGTGFQFQPYTGNNVLQ